MAIIGNSIGTLDPYSERLASLPEIVRRAAPGDGSEPGEGDAEDESKILPPGKTLESADAATLFKVTDALVRSQDRPSKNRWAIDTHYNRVRAGVPFGRLEKVPNQSLWVAKLPNGMTKESSGATPNKADDLCNKIVDTLMADPPKLIPLPRKNDEAAQAAADLAAQFLLQDGGEAGTNDNELYRWALQHAMSAASSILHYRVDPSGGGYQPLQQLADPMATDPTAEITTASPVMRYVSTDNQFVDNAADADRVWLPKIVVDRMWREQARTFPFSAPPELAKAVILLCYGTLADGRERWPKTVGTMGTEAIQKLSQWSPPQGETLILPFAFRGTSSGATGPELSEVGSFAPLLQRRMYWYRLYIKASPEYENGFWADISGANGGTLLEQGTLDYTVTVPGQGKVRRCRDIPVVMIRPQEDVNNGDPLGWALIARFAGASEAEATLMAAFMDVCDNMLHPHVFLRSTTAIDDDDWADRTMPTILGPQDAEPTYEHFPPMPPILEVVQHLEQRQDTASGMAATAQGLESPTSQSGVAKNLTIRQALISLSGTQQNLHSGMTRGGRIKCQLVQAEFKTSQLMDLAGEDESGQARWWTGEDFAGIDNIGIQPGTGTMMTAEGKAQYVAFLQSQNWMTPEQAGEVALPGIKNDLGIPDDPIDNSIEREVGFWLQGPPKAGADPTQPAAPPATPFTPRPNDNETVIATKVMKRLSKLMFDPKYTAFKQSAPEWAAFVDQRYQSAAQAVTAAQSAAADADGKAKLALAQAQTQGDLQVAQLKEQGEAQRAQLDQSSKAADQSHELLKLVLSAALNPKVQAGDARGIEAGAVQKAEATVPPAASAPAPAISDPAMAGV